MKLFVRSQGVKHNFWQNYTDLMSGLMIIFLIASLGYIVSVDDGRKIKAIISAQKELADKSQYFRYNEQYNRFECKIDVNFPAYSVVHDEIQASTIPEGRRASLIAAGKELKNFINTQRKKYKGIDFEIIIDGRVAGKPIEGRFPPKLSFMRAYSLYELWKTSGIFDNTKDNIHAAGSGFGGIGRYPVKSDSNRTFIINVIPYLKK